MLGYLVSVLHCVVLMLLDVLWRVHVILRCQPKKSKTIVLPQCWCCSDVIICSQPLEYGVTCRVLVLWWYLRRIPVLSSSYLFLPLGCSYQVCCYCGGRMYSTNPDDLQMFSWYTPDLEVMLWWCFGSVWWQAESLEVATLPHEAANRAHRQHAAAIQVTV